ncbi:MAG: PspA/IM30 family protein [Thermoguttaceae bacterium]
MGVFKRISDIISANLNDMADGLEDPERMLKQAVREMEETIAEVTSQTAKAMANETTLQRELDRNRSQRQQWQSRAEKAVEEGSDDLARKALARKNEHDKLVAALQDQLNAAQEASANLRCQLAAMKAKLAEGKRNLATLSARQRAADFRKKMETQSAVPSSEVDQNAFAKFDRMRAKVEQAEAEAAAMAELRTLGNDAVSETSADNTDEDANVSAELDELKRKLRK